MAMLNPYNYKKPKNAMKAKQGNKKHLHAVKNEATSKKDQYLEQKIMAARPEQLTLMLYEGLVRFLKQGKLFMNGGKESFEKVNNSLQRGQAIMNELRSTLDMDIDISENLDALYEYMTRRTVEANIDKDQEILDEVVGLAEELRDTWQEAIEKI
jgi:flagellar protein FliS